MSEVWRCVDCFDIFSPFNFAHFGYPGRQGTVGQLPPGPQLVGPAGDESHLGITFVVLMVGFGFWSQDADCSHLVGPNVLRCTLHGARRGFGIGLD